MDKKTERVVYPEGGYGWVIVFAIILINSSLLTLIQCFGLIFRDEFAQWGVSSAQTSFLLHSHSSMYCFFGFFSSPFLKKYGMRSTAFTGAILMCLGIFLSSFATSYIYLVLSVSILIGLGQGILMPATYLATYTYFKKRLTIAVSISVTGASLSSVIMPKICDILLNQIGRRYTVLTLFGVSLLSLVGCYLLKPIVNSKNREEVEECVGVLGVRSGGAPQNGEEICHDLLSVQRNVVYEKNAVFIIKKNPARDTVWSKISNMFDLHLLRDVPFVLIVIGLGVSFASELNIILMLQFILRELSLFERAQVANAVSIQSIADISGRLVVPFLSHFWNAPSKLMYCSALIAASLGRSILASWSQSKEIVFGAIAIIGVTKGSRAVFQSVIIPKYVPLEKIPAANGLNMLFTGAVSLVIGPIIGAVHDRTQSYVYALHVASGLSILCVTMWIMESIFRKKPPSEIRKI